MKKILICVLAGIMVMTCCAFAAEDEPEETPDVLDTEETAEPDPSYEESDPPAVEETAAPDTAPTVSPDPVESVRPVIHGGVISSLGDDETPEANETPESTPEPEGETMSFDEEVLNTLGNIYGILLFFVVVILAYFVYKFFRIFF